MSVGTWITKEGKILKMSEMETSHIQNCIAMLERNMPNHEKDDTYTPEHWSFGSASLTIPGAGYYRKKIAEFKKELKRKGDCERCQ